MRIAVWSTGHEIADTVAKSIDGRHFNTSEFLEEIIKDYDCHIAYGILRGADNVFMACNRLGKPWIHLDRGYWGADHYGGKYRISLRGTQQVNFWPDPIAHEMLLQPWRGFDESKAVLVCPPTLHVMDFFDMEKDKIWTWKPQTIFPKNYVIRQKGDPSSINFQDYNYILTFNSSVGWQAIAAGIPCVSDSTHSMVGSFFKNIPLAKLSKAQYLDREKMFGCMSALQLTLEEIKQGKIWPLASKLLSLSATTAANQLPLTSAPIP